MSLNEPLEREIEQRNPDAGDLYLDSLMRNLHEGDERAQILAIQALGAWGDSRAIWPLYSVIHIGERDDNSRRTAAEALDQLRAKNVVKSLIQSLQDNHGDQRYNIVRDLGELGDKRAIEPLIQALQANHADVDFRSRAAMALGQLGDMRGIEILAQVRDDSSCDERIRSHASWSLGWLVRDWRVESVILTLNADSPMVRKWAADTLWNLGDRRAVEPLIQALQDENANVRYSAIRALVAMGEVIPLEPLLDVLGDSDATMRCWAISLLGEQGDKRAIEPVFGLLSDDNVWCQAAMALAKLGDRRAVEPLFRVLQDGTCSSDLRHDAALLLKTFGDPRVAVYLEGQSIPHEERDELPPF